jgi:hypothetical protein
MGRVKNLAIDDANARRGRNNRQRGHGFERRLAAELLEAGLAGKRVGQYLGATDVAADGWVIQAKKGGAFSNRYWDWLTQLNPKADERAVLIVADAPGSGGRERRLVVLSYEDWLQIAKQVKL